MASKRADWFCRIKRFLFQINVDFIKNFLSRIASCDRTQYESDLNRLSSWQKARTRGQKYDDLVLSIIPLRALSDSCLFFHFVKRK